MIKLYCLTETMILVYSNMHGLEIRCRFLENSKSQTGLTPVVNSSKRLVNVNSDLDLTFLETGPDVLNTNINQGGSPLLSWAFSSPSFLLLLPPLLTLPLMTPLPILLRFLLPTHLLLSSSSGEYRTFKLKECVTLIGQMI